MGVKKIWLLAPFLLVLLFTQTAYGGVFSSLTGLLASSVGQVSAIVKQKDEIQSETNSQNLDLPEPINSQATSSPKNEIDQTITGGSAILPESGPLGTAIDLKDNQTPSDLISVYTVHTGDTVGTIANMFNVSVNTIYWANDLKKGAPLKTGDTIVILPVTGVQITVKKGDTVKSLAKKYGGDVDEIVAYNDLNSATSLTVGDTIIIPNGEESAIVSSTGKKIQKAPIKYSGPSFAGYYLRPISGGKRTQGIHGNNAVDIAAPAGTPILAAASGRIILARRQGSYGNYVVIAHPNGTQTLYAHASQLYVSVGQQISQGETIAAVGSTGNSTGYHLHFEVRGARNPF